MQLKKTSEEKPNTAALDNKISSVEEEKIATNHKDDELEYNEEVDVENSIDDISLDIERNMTLDGCGVANTSDGKPPQSSSKYPLQSSVSPEVCYIGWKLLFCDLFPFNHQFLCIVSLSDSEAMWAY